MSDKLEPDKDVSKLKRMEQSNNTKQISCCLDDYMNSLVKPKQISRDVINMQPSESPTAEKNIEFIFKTEKLLYNAEKQISKIEMDIPRLQDDILNINLFSDSSSEKDSYVCIPRNLFLTSYQSKIQNSVEDNARHDVIKEMFKSDFDKATFGHVHNHKSNQLCGTCLNTTCVKHALISNDNIPVKKSSDDLRFCKGNCSSVGVKTFAGHECQSFPGLEGLNQCNFCNYKCGNQLRHEFCDKVNRFNVSNVGNNNDSLKRDYFNDTQRNCVIENSFVVEPNVKDDVVDVSKCDVGTAKGVPFRSTPNTKIVNMRAQGTTNMDVNSFQDDFLDVFSRRLVKQTLPNVDIKPSLTKQFGPVVHIPCTPKFRSKKDRDRNIGIVEVKHGSCLDEGNRNFVEKSDGTRARCVVTSNVTDDEVVPIHETATKPLSRFRNVFNNPSDEVTVSNDQIQERLRNVVQVYSEKLQYEGNRMTKPNQQLIRTLLLLDEIIDQLYDKQMYAYIKSGASSSVAPPLTYRMKMVTDLLWRELEVRTHPTDEHCVQIGEILNYLVEDIKKSVANNSKNVLSPPQNCGRNEPDLRGRVSDGIGIHRYCRSRDIGKPTDKTVTVGRKDADKVFEVKLSRSEVRQYATNKKQGDRRGSVSLMSNDGMESKDLKESNCKNVTITEECQYRRVPLQSTESYLIKEKMELDKLRRMRRIYELNRRLHNMNYASEVSGRSCDSFDHDDGVIINKNDEDVPNMHTLSAKTSEVSFGIDVNKEGNTSGKDVSAIENDEFADNEAVVEDDQMESENNIDGDIIEKPSTVMLLHEAEVQEVNKENDTYEDDFESEDDKKVDSNENSIIKKSADVSSVNDSVKDNNGVKEIVSEYSNIIDVNGIQKTISDNVYEALNDKSCVEDSISMNDSKSLNEEESIKDVFDDEEIVQTPDVNTSINTSNDSKKLQSDIVVDLEKSIKDVTERLTAVFPELNDVNDNVEDIEKPLDGDEFGINYLSDNNDRIDEGDDMILSKLNCKEEFGTDDDLLTGSSRSNITRKPCVTAGKNTDNDVIDLTKPSTSLHLRFPVESEINVPNITMTSNVDNQEIRIMLDIDHRIASSTRSIGLSPCNSLDNMVKVQINSPRNVQYDELRSNYCVDNQQATGIDLVNSTSNVTKRLELDSCINNNMRSIIEKTVEEVFERFQRSVTKEKREEVLSDLVAPDVKLGTNELVNVEGNSCNELKYISKGVGSCNVNVPSLENSKENDGFKRVERDRKAARLTTSTADSNFSSSYSSSCDSYRKCLGIVESTASSDDQLSEGEIKLCSIASSSTIGELKLPGHGQLYCGGKSVKHQSRCRLRDMLLCQDIDKACHVAGDTEKSSDYRFLSNTRLKSTNFTDIVEKVLNDLRNENDSMTTNVDTNEYIKSDLMYTKKVQCNTFDMPSTSSAPVNYERLINVGLHHRLVNFDYTYSNVSRDKIGNISEEDSSTDGSYGSPYLNRRKLMINCEKASEFDALKICVSSNTSDAEMSEGQVILGSI